MDDPWGRISFEGNINHCQMPFILTRSWYHRNLFELVRQVPFGIWDGHYITSISSLLATAELPLARAFAQNGRWPHEGCHRKIWSKGNLQHHSWFELPILGLLLRSLREKWWCFV